MGADHSGEGEEKDKVSSALREFGASNKAGKHKLIENLYSLKLESAQQYFKRAGFVMRSAENSHGLYAESVLRDCEAGYQLAGGHQYEDELLVARSHYAWWQCHDAAKVAVLSAQLLQKYPLEKHYLESGRINELAGNISRARVELEQAYKLFSSLANAQSLAVFYAKDHNYQKSLQVIDAT